MSKHQFNHKKAKNTKHNKSREKTPIYNKINMLQSGPNENRHGFSQNISILPYLLCCIVLADI